MCDLHQFPQIVQQIKQNVSSLQIQVERQSLILQDLEENPPPMWSRILSTLAIGWQHPMVKNYQQRFAALKLEHTTTVLQLDSLSRQLDLLSTNFPFLILNSDDFETGVFNVLDGFCDRPHELIRLLEKVTNYLLTKEQYEIALRSLTEKTAETDSELRPLDLFELWETTPALGKFALHIKRNFLPN